MKTILILISFIPFQFCISQNVITGIITTENDDPLEYANIGVKNKSFGAISDSAGNFSLDISKANPDDTLIISYLGFETKKLLVSYFFKNESISLIEQSTMLDEILVTNGRLPKGKKRARGYKSKTKRIVTGWYNNGRGEESGIVVKNRGKEIKIDKVCFQVADNTYDSVKMRLRIRNVLNDFPGEDFLIENMFVEVKAPGQYCVDVSFNEIYSKDSFYVGLELISVGKSINGHQERDKITLSGSLRGNLYFKETSASQWKKYGRAGPSIQVFLTEF